jgi:hypothetical protein
VLHGNATTLSRNYMANGNGKKKKNTNERIEESAKAEFLTE